MRFFLAGAGLAEAGLAEVTLIGPHGKMTELANEYGLKQSDVTMSAPRPANVSLDSGKAFELGYNPSAVRPELERLFLSSDGK